MFLFNPIVPRLAFKPKSHRTILSVLSTLLNHDFTIDTISCTGINMEKSTKQHKLVGFLERCAIPSFKHVIVHICIAIVLLIIFFLTLKDLVVISGESLG